MTTLIKNGTVVTADLTYKADVLIDGGKIIEIGDNLKGDETLDATGCYVMPGGIDPHTHLEMPFMGTYSSDDFESGTRAALDFFEAEEATGRIKVNPLAHWSVQDIANYMEANDLPKHPLIEKGYPSIGCEPCTSEVKAGEDARAGRWRGLNKSECGIHLDPKAALQEGAGA